MQTLRRLPARRANAGFSITELIVVCALIGILITLSLPSFVRYYQTAAVKAAAEELAAFINQGRQTAIRLNQPVCVHADTGSIHFHLATCAGTTWVGAGTDASGNLKLPAGAALTTTADPIFNYLGAATPAATYTITMNTRTLRVVVAASGRITITP